MNHILIDTFGQFNIFKVKYSENLPGFFVGRSFNASDICVFSFIIKKSLRQVFRDSYSFDFHSLLPRF